MSFRATLEEAERHAKRVIGISPSRTNDSLVLPKGSGVYLIYQNNEVIYRVAYTLGGKGAGVAHNARELKRDSHTRLGAKQDNPSACGRVRGPLEGSRV